MVVRALPVPTHYSIASNTQNMRLPLLAPSSRLLRSPWLLPACMIGISAMALLAARVWTDWSRLLYLVPYTFLGNSLAPLPYDGAVLYLGGRYSLAADRAGGGTGDAGDRGLEHGAADPTDGPRRHAEGFGLIGSPSGLSGAIARRHSGLWWPPACCRSCLTIPCEFWPCWRNTRCGSTSSRWCSAGEPAISG